MDWKGLVRSIAPALGTALGGPAVGMATKVLSQTLLGKDKASTDELAQAVTTASPEELAKIQEADHQFKLKLEQLGIDLEKLAAEDRDSARNREIQLKDKAPKILAAVVVIGFFSILGTMMSTEIPASAQQAVNILLGALTGMMMQVGNYYFGSSAGSARKTELMTVK